LPVPVKLKSSDLAQSGQLEFLSLLTSCQRIGWPRCVKFPYHYSAKPMCVGHQWNSQSDLNWRLPIEWVNDLQRR
jgi:hypothetical protein